MFVPREGIFIREGGLGDSCFFSASWQQGDLCPPCPDKNSSTSVRREPNIGVRRSRTAMGDCCISMPTMFSVPGGTPSAGIAKGDAPLASFLPYLSRSKDRVGGFGGRSAPVGRGRRRRPIGPSRRDRRSPPARVSGQKRQAGRRPAREKGGKAAHPRPRQRTPIPACAASAKKKEEGKTRSFKKMPVKCLGCLAKRPVLG